MYIFTESSSWEERTALSSAKDTAGRAYDESVFVKENAQRNMESSCGHVRGFLVQHCHFSTCLCKCKLQVCKTFHVAA